jgi:hypothetical protein
VLIFGVFFSADLRDYARKEPVKGTHKGMFGIANKGRIFVHKEQTAFARKEQKAA